MSDTKTKSLLKEVKVLIEKVNAILPDDKKVSLEQKERIYVKNLFVCEYKDQFNTGIEIFGKTEETSAEYTSPEYIHKFGIALRDECYLYESISSDKKAILYTRIGKSEKYEWAKIGNSFNYYPVSYTSSKIVANCELTNIISYNDVRTSMLSDGVINSFNLNYTTREEITRVLAYLHSNYLKKENRYPRRLEKNS